MYMYIFVCCIIFFLIFRFFLIFFVLFFIIEYVMFNYIISRYVYFLRFVVDNCEFIDN